MNGTLIGATAPAATALLAALVLGERLRAAQWAGVVLSIAGVVLVVSGGSLASLFALSLNRGDLLIAGAVICWAVYRVGSRNLVRRHRPVTVTACTFSWPRPSPYPSQRARRPSLAGSPCRARGRPGPRLFLATVSVLGFVWWKRGSGRLRPVADRRLQQPGPDLGHCPGYPCSSARR